MKILLTGDVHIGRRSTRLPGHVLGHDHSGSAAWTRIVDLATRLEVDLVLVTGDLIDKENRYLEAVGKLEAGVQRLHRAGIETVVVGGNHDHDVLPALVDSIGSSAFRLLGRGGRWERYTFEKAGDRVHLDGWSFPRSHHPESPLGDYQPLRDGSPVLAMLHADLEVPGSRYAPIFLPDLRRHPEVLFLLGHIHAPRASGDTGARFIYPGSPQALDPRETGRHGPWELRIEGGELTAFQHPLSTVWYAPLEVAASDLQTPEDIDSRVFAAVRARVNEAGDEFLGVQRALFHVRVSGPSAFGRAIEARLGEVARDFELSVGSVTASIERVTVAVTPAYDLADLAAGVGSPAVLASLLRAPTLDPVLAGELRRLVQEIHTSRTYLELLDESEGPADLEAVASEAVRFAAAQLLDELLLQKGEAT